MRYAVAALLVLLAALRFCHVEILWVEEAYPSAAAAEVLRGKWLYRDVWFDKPPLYALVYALWDALPGWPLRAGGALFVVATCAAAWRCFGMTTAALLGFFLTFGVPSAVMPLAPDLLLAPLHLVAIRAARERRALLAGLMAGIGLMVNTKALFVLAACALWLYRSPGLLLAGFALPNVLALALLGLTGAWTAYVEQVWRWGLLYSRDTFVAHPVREALVRTANWSGFHAAAVIPALAYLARRSGDGWRLTGWCLLSLLAVAAGWRFFPRYYFHLLIPMVVIGGMGLERMRARTRWALLLLLIVPLLRFGPRYAELAADLVNGREHAWTDIAMYQDSKRVAALLREREGDLLVWGYRPDVFVLTRLPAATRYLESQPLTGVFADRHLSSSGASDSGRAIANRAQLQLTSPRLIVDGLGPLNGNLAITAYPELGAWLSHYDEVARTPMSVIYQRRD